jgi:hypothetical protein
MKKSPRRTEGKKLVLHRETILHLQERDLHYVAGQAPTTSREVPFDSTIAATGCC